MPSGEDYVRPPLVAREAPSQRVAVWRFRAYLLVALLLLGLGIFFAARAIVGGGEGSPDVGSQTLGATHVFFGGNVRA